MRNNLRKKKGTDIGSGKPGQARVKAMEKREKTLLVEYLAKNKDNVVRDRRIGVRSGDQVCDFEAGTHLHMYVFCYTHSLKMSGRRCSRCSSWSCNLLTFLSRIKMPVGLSP